MFRLSLISSEPRLVEPPKRVFAFYQPEQLLMSLSLTQAPDGEYPQDAFIEGKLVFETKMRRDVLHVVENLLMQGLNHHTTLPYPHKTQHTYTTPISPLTKLHQDKA